MRAGGQRDTAVAETIGGDGDLAQIVVVGGAMALAGAEVGAIATGRQEPEEVELVGA
jgi:hypothetical protein